MSEQCAPPAADLYIPNQKNLILPPPTIEHTEPAELQEWLDWNDREADRELAAVLPDFRKMAAERRDPAKGSIAIYVRAGARTEFAEMAGLVARKVIRRGFAHKDGNNEDEILGGYSPKTDALGLTISLNDKTGILEPTGAINSKIQTQDTMLPAFTEIKETWHRNPVAFMAAKNLGHLICNPKVREIVSVATTAGNELVAATMLYNFTCLDSLGIFGRLIDLGNNGPEDYFVANLDETPAKALNNAGDGKGFLDMGLPHVNFHARKPNANKTGLYICDLLYWQRTMNDHQRKRYWTADNLLYTKRYQTIIPD